MLNIPNSGAMDAAAGGAGPSTIALPQIIGGNPAAILAHAAEVMQRATKLVGLLEDLERSKRQLRVAWPAGSASDHAQRKLSNSFRNFNDTIQAVFSGVRELEAAAAKLDVAQNAYRSIVSAVNPTVAALLSNPWTQAAARALATSASSSLSGFLKSIAGVLNAIGAGNIGSIVTSLATIVGEIEKLFSKGGGGGSGGGSNGGGEYRIQPYPNPGGTPVQQPGGIPPVASPSGNAAIGGGYPGTGGYPGMGGGYPGAGYPGTGGGYPGMPGYYPPALNPGNGWIAVDPSTGGTMPVTEPPVTTLPAPAPLPEPAPPGDGGGADGGGADGGGDDDVTITASKGDLKVTVEVPVDTGRDFEVEVSAESGGQSITQHVDVDADGSVSVK